MSGQTSAKSSRIRDERRTGPRLRIDHRAVSAATKQDPLVAFVDNSTAPQANEHVRDSQARAAAFDLVAGIFARALKRQKRQ